ncbi:hypothetical protein HAX54_006807, partial [Datura stramonium]|nr:hypothetical protein [Datura stramonium]
SCGIYSPKFKKNYDRAKAARASRSGGSLNTRVSMSFTVHRWRMTKLKGEEVSLAEIFEETHKKKKKDGIREECVNPV